MDSLASKWKSFTKSIGDIFKDEEEQWQSKGQGRKLGGVAAEQAPPPKGAGGPAGQAALDAAMSRSERAQQAGSSRAYNSRSGSAPQPARGAPSPSPTPGAPDDAGMPHMPPPPVRLHPPPSPSAGTSSQLTSVQPSPARQSTRGSFSSVLTDVLPNGQPYITSRSSHLHATDVMQQVVLDSVVMVNTPTGAEVSALGSHLAMRDVQQAGTDSPPQLRGAAGSINTPTAGERLMGLSGGWQPDAHQDFHMQQCLALIVSQDEELSKPCLATLHRVLRNIVANPSQPKYRTLRLANPSIQASVVQVRGALELLDAVGFTTVFQTPTAAPPLRSPSLASQPSTVTAAAIAAGSVEPFPLQHDPGANAGQGPGQGCGTTGAPAKVLLESVGALGVSRADVNGRSSNSLGDGASRSSRSLHSGGSMNIRGQTTMELDTGVLSPSPSTARYLATHEGEEGSRSPGAAVRVVRAEGQRGIRSTSMQRRVSGSTASGYGAHMELAAAAVAAAATMAAGATAASGSGSGVEGLEVAGISAGGAGRSGPEQGLGTPAGATEPVEGLLVLPEDAPLHPLRLGLHELEGVMQVVGLDALLDPNHGRLTQEEVHQSMLDSPAASAAGESHAQPCVPASPQTSSPPPPSPPAVPATVAPAPVPTPQQPVNRNTQVVLPVAPDTQQDMPDWFYDRTGADLKAEVAALARKRAAGEVLMTRSWRERLAEQQGGAGTTKPSPNGTATLRVRFPEGVFLQGSFGGWEAATAVFEWVTEALRYPEVSYELVRPGRKPLPAGGRLCDLADLWPAAVLNFRLLGTDGAHMASVPLLSDTVLRLTQVE